MSDAKYKVGQEVTYGEARGPAVVVAVRPAGWVYDLRWGNGAKDVVHGYRECDLTPYVPPLGVGDRVRSSSFSGVYCIKAIHMESAWIWSDDGKYVTRPLYDLERIPTEANQ